MSKKIAYISSPFVADSDMPLLHELQQQADVDFFLILQEKEKNRMLVNVKQLKPRGDVYAMADYADLSNLSAFVHIDKSYVVNMPGLHDWSPSNLMAVARLTRLLHRRHYDVVHITWPLRYGLFPLYLFRKRMVLTVHDPLPHSSEDTRLNRFHRSVAMKLVPRFILLNHYQREAFITKYQLDGRRVFQQRLGRYDYLRDITPILPLSKSYVLFVGSINTHKGVDILCQAMQQVHATLPGLKLIVAGSGTLYFDTKPYIEQGFLELHNHFLTDGELVGFIQKSAFVVCPYLDATQSGIVMSAFALDRPVIATRTGGLPEMVEDGRHGLLLPPADIGALADAIRLLATTPGMLQQMRRYIAYDYGQGERSWPHIAANMVEIYHESTTPIHL